MRRDGSIEKQSKILPLRGVLTLLLAGMVLLCFASCTGRYGPPAPPTQAFEGNISQRASFSLNGFKTVDDPARLGDGDRSTYVRFTGLGGPGEIVIDLGALYRVCRLDIYPAYDGPNKGICFPASIDVLCSADGKKYERAVSYKNVEAPDCVPVLEFSPVDARYVKLVINDCDIPTYSMAWAAEIAEIEVISFFGEYAYPI